MDLLRRLRRRDRTPATSDRPAAHRVRRWRRAGAVACAALAVGTGVQAVAPPPPETARAVVAAGDVTPGTPLTEEHLEEVELPQDAVTWSPAGADALVGRTVAVPLAAGDPVTERALLPDGRQVPAGQELVFLPVLDPPVLQAAGSGSTVRLIERETGRTVARRATVRGSVAPDPESPDAVGGLWVALTPEESDAVAGAGGAATGLDTPVAVVLVAPAGKGAGDLGPDDPEKSDDSRTKVAG